MLQPIGAFSVQYLKSIRPVCPPLLLSSLKLYLFGWMIPAQKGGYIPHRFGWRSRPVHMNGSHGFLHSLNHTSHTLNEPPYGRACGIALLGVLMLLFWPATCESCAVRAATQMPCRGARSAGMAIACICLDVGSEVRLQCKRHLEVRAALLRLAKHSKTLRAYLFVIGRQPVTESSDAHSFKRVCECLI